MFCNKLIIFASVEDAPLYGVSFFFFQTLKLLSSGGFIVLPVSFLSCATKSEMLLRST